MVIFKGNKKNKGMLIGVSIKYNIVECVGNNNCVD